MSDFNEEWDYDCEWKVWRRAGLSYHEWRTKTDEWILKQHFNGQSEEVIVSGLAMRWPGIRPECQPEFYRWYTRRFLSNWENHFKNYFPRMDKDRGRPKKITMNDLMIVKEILDLEPKNFDYKRDRFFYERIGWTVRLLQDVMRRWGKEMSEKTLRRILHRMGYRWDQEEEGFVWEKKKRITAQEFSLLSTPPAAGLLDMFITLFRSYEKQILKKKINATPPDPALVS
jgi:transposase